jgi:hypothetical protein
MEFKTGSSLTSPSDKRIEWFEKTYRVTLPPEYVVSLKTGNGAIPETNLFNQAGRERLIERMLCLLENPSSDQANGWADITVVMTQLDARLIDDEQLVGMNVIPIAALFGGDFLCLDYRADPQNPVVAVWDHEQSEEFQPSLEVVANSFRQFDTLLRR